MTSAFEQDLGILRDVVQSCSGIRIAARVHFIKPLFYDRSQLFCNEREGDDEFSVL